MKTTAKFGHVGRPGDAGRPSREEGRGGRSPARASSTFRTGGFRTLISQA